jgi:hypothetical protein
LRFELAHGLQGDCTKRRVGRLPVFYRGRHRRDEQIRKSEIFRVKGAFSACASNAIANTKSCVERINRFNNSRRAVAERRRRVQAVADFFDGGFPAEIARRVEDFADLVGPGPRFLKQTHPRLLDLHFFGADADN